MCFADAHSPNQEQARFFDRVILHKVLNIGNSDGQGLVKDLDIFQGAMCIASRNLRGFEKSRTPISEIAVATCDPIRFSRNSYILPTCSIAYGTRFVWS